MTSSRSCGSVIPETADRKAAAAVEPFAVDTGGGAGQLDIVVEPDDIAENYAHLHAQPKNAWTFELDLRPYCERH